MTQDLQYKGQWGALLISMHMSFLYESWLEESSEFAAFLDEQLEHQKRWGVTKKEAAAAYALFQWCDRMSLILCRRELPESERALEVSAGPNGTHYNVICRNDIITIQPWPFEEIEFIVSVETRRLPQLSFKDDPELLSLLQQTPVTDVRWEFRK